MPRLLIDNLASRNFLISQGRRKLQVDENYKEGDSALDKQQEAPRPELRSDFQARLEESAIWLSASTQTTTTKRTAVELKQTFSSPPPPPVAPLVPPSPPSPPLLSPPLEILSFARIEADSVSGPTVYCSSSPTEDKEIDPAPAGIPGVDLDEEGFLSSDKCVACCEPAACILHSPSYMCMIREAHAVVYMVLLLID
jgi:hypothetical protein